MSLAIGLVLETEGQEMQSKFTGTAQVWLADLKADLTFASGNFVKQSLEKLHSEKQHEQRVVYLL